MTKYIFITGGVVSSIGKGIVAASLGRLLKNRGLTVAIQKFDPYINIDPGTMSPYQHGEVFVTEDGAETDLDLGHYERFIDLNLSQLANVTMGKVYEEVLAKERKGDYLGGTVQVVPHVTNEIKTRLKAVAERDEVEIVITEIGGTVGDIESLPFLEALRQMKSEVGRENVLYLHTTLLPYIKVAGELKTKPTQHSVKELRSLGIQPDILVLRSEVSVPEAIKEKLALFCDVPATSVIESVDVETLYSIPLNLHKQGLDRLVCEHFNLPTVEADLNEWRALEQRVLHLQKKTRIALVGKYVSLPDAYLSVVEALKHGGFAHHSDVEIDWIEAERVTDANVATLLAEADGLIVPGGFGERGLVGKMSAIRYARETNLPFLGICLGMQLACIEFGRNVLGLKEADSSETNPTAKDKVIDLMHAQREVEELGGTLRLGAYPCKLVRGTKAWEIYGEQGEISERHRHRYEFNDDYRQQFEGAGLVFSGVSPDNHLVEIVELTEHNYFVACQFHPEFSSRPNRPHPLFKEFIAASLEK